MFVPLWQPASDIFLYACAYFEANKYDDDDDAEPCSARYVSVATLNVIRYGRAPCRVKDCSQHVN